MYSVRKYSKAILLCSLTNPGFKSITKLYLDNMQIDDQNTDPIPCVYYCSVKYLIPLDYTSFQLKNFFL